MSDTDDEDFKELEYQINNLDEGIEDFDYHEYDELTKLGKIVKSTNETKKLLPPIISEYLSCYKLVGFDLHGNEINITKHKTPIEKNALESSFMKEFSNLMSAQKHDT